MVMLIKFLPRNLASWICGVMVRIRFPRLMQARLNEVFVWFFGIDMSEASSTVVHYRSIEDVFVRQLRSDARPVKSDFVSPADGRIVRSAPLFKSQILQAKDLWYSPNDLSKIEHEWMWSTTVYLAPHNYHRVHAPAHAQLQKIEYISGTLWPVNHRFVSKIPALFCENERLVFDFSLSQGGRMALVMVGALNVGRMTSALLPGFASNRPLTRSQTFRFERSIEVACGQEIGVFMLGSTVVMLMDSPAMEWSQPLLVEDRPILQGESLKGMI